MAAPDVAARSAGGRRGIEPTAGQGSTVGRAPRRVAVGAGSQGQQFGFVRLAGEAAAVAAAAFGWACVLVRAWTLPWDIPLDPRADTTLHAALLKSINEQGWWLHQPRLGAPFGQELYDFPHGGETFQLFGLKLLMKLTGGWGSAMNVYFLLGFGVLAAVTFLVLRHLRFGPVVAAIASLIYTFLPYHLWHGESHIFRSTYVSAPLAALLLVWLGSWRERFLVEPDRLGPHAWRHNLRTGRLAGALLVAAVIGGTETMTTAFAMTLLASSAVVATIRWREPARLLLAGLLVVAIAAVFALCSAPSLLYWHQHGSNDEAAQRYLTEGEHYSLKITRLVLPEPGHRSHVLSNLGERAQASSDVASEGGLALGFLGTAGFLGALYSAVAGPRRTRGGDHDAPDVRPAWDRASLRDQAGTITVLALLFATVGGASVLLGLLGFEQVRVWNRIVVIVAFFAMVMACTWAERLAEVVAVRAGPLRSPLRLSVLATVVLAFGLWDGIGVVHRPYPDMEAQRSSDVAFVGRIEAALPDGAAVMQVPVLTFPENGPQLRMADYDPLRAYLADDGSLRWSYGAVKGRPQADWQERVVRQGTVASLPALVALGFQGLWFDTFGYADPGSEAAAVQATVGVKPLRSADGRFLFFDLRPYAGLLHLTSAQARATAVKGLGIAPPRTAGASS